MEPRWPVVSQPAFAGLEACATGAAALDHRVRLPGSPKRKLREYGSIHRKPIRIPSARASGFKGAGAEP